MERKTVTQSIAYSATYVCVIMTTISCILVRKRHCVLTTEVKDYAYYCLMLRHFLMTLSLYELNRCVLTLQLNDYEQHLYVTLSFSCVVHHFPHRAAWSFAFRSRIFRSCVFHSRSSPIARKEYANKALTLYLVTPGLDGGFHSSRTLLGVIILARKCCTMSG